MAPKSQFDALAASNLAFCSQKVSILRPETESSQRKVIQDQVSSSSTRKIVARKYTKTNLRRPKTTKTTTTPTTIHMKRCQMTSRRRLRGLLLPVAFAMLIIALIALIGAQPALAQLSKGQRAQLPVPIEQQQQVFGKTLPQSPVAQVRNQQQQRVQPSNGLSNYQATPTRLPASGKTSSNRLDGPTTVLARQQPQPQQQREEDNSYQQQQQDNYGTKNAIDNQNDDDSASDNNDEQRRIGTGSGTPTTEDPLANSEPALYGSVAGAPGVDFPGYTTIPKTSFTCEGKGFDFGFYADEEAGCQVYHVCWSGRRESFLCGIGTVFNQAILACDYWHSVDCSKSSQFYSVNSELGKAGAEPASGGSQRLQTTSGGSRTGSSSAALGGSTGLSSSQGAGGVSTTTSTSDSTGSFGNFGEPINQRRVNYGATKSSSPSSNNFGGNQYEQQRQVTPSFDDTAQQQSINSINNSGEQQLQQVRNNANNNNNNNNYDNSVGQRTSYSQQQQAIDNNFSQQPFRDNNRQSDSIKGARQFEQRQESAFVSQPPPPTTTTTSTTTTSTTSTTTSRPPSGVKSISGLKQQQQQPQIRQQPIAQRFNMDLNQKVNSLIESPVRPPLKAPATTGKQRQQQQQQQQRQQLQQVSTRKPLIGANFAQSAVARAQQTGSQTPNNLRSKTSTSGENFRQHQQQQVQYNSDIDEPQQQQQQQQLNSFDDSPVQTSTVQSPTSTNNYRSSISRQSQSSNINDNNNNFNNIPLSQQTIVQSGSPSDGSSAITMQYDTLLPVNQQQQQQQTPIGQTRSNANGPDSQGAYESSLADESADDFRSAGAKAAASHNQNWYIMRSI